MTASTTRIKQFIIVIVILAILIVAAAIYFRPKTDLPKPVKIDTTGQPTLGKADAPLHIVVFEDLKCGNCMRFNLTLLPTIKKEYIDTGKAKYTMINLAFIPGSMPAANTARCLYVQKNQYFFDFVNYVYQHQPPEDQNWATIPTLLTYANTIQGVNKAKLTQCMLQNKYTSTITHNLTIAKNVMGTTVATPAVYVNGIPIKPLTLTRFRQVAGAEK